MNDAGSLLRIAVCCWLATASQAASADRYWGERRDGETFTGDKLRDFHKDKSGPRLDNERLFDGDNPVRLLRDTTRSPQAPASYIELANGDRLAGKVVAASLGGVEVDQLLIGESLHSGQMRVRLDWVRRICAKRRPLPVFTPGFVELADGRQLSARSLRWEGDGVKLLTDDGVVAARYESIVELHATRDDVWLPPLPGAALLDVAAPVVLRLATAQGEMLTVPRTMLHEATSSDFARRGWFAARRRRSAKFASPRLATRPPWSLETLYFDPQQIALATWLDATELPLSLLPVVEVQEKRSVHHLPWQLQRSVLGDPLQCGDAVAELGVGMHSFTRLAFQLPPHARSFSTRVGFHGAAAEGGCVHLRIWRDNTEGSPLWERKFFRGGDGLQQVGPLDIAGAALLILEVDFADADRPHGADPLDIRDWIDWLMPLVTVDEDRARTEFTDLAQLVPEISGWSVAPKQLARLQLRPCWFERHELWSYAMQLDEPLVLSRSMPVTLASALLPVRAGRDDASREVFVVRVQARGEKVPSTMNGNLGTHNSGRMADRHHVLPASSEPVRVDIIAEPHDREREAIEGVVWDVLAPQPLVRNLPPNAAPIAPDVPLAALAPLRATAGGRRLELRSGKLTSGEPLTVHGWPFAEGYGVPTGSEITYRLDPAWRSFVAVLGLADGWQGAGPYQILLDGKPHWESDSLFARNDPGEQIRVPLPPGHETITLRLLGSESSGAWAHAGFLSDAE